jgi:hypothetical protein
MGEMTNAYNIFVGKPEGKRHSGDLGVDGKIFRMALSETRLEDVDWIHLTQDRDQ